MQWGLVTGSIDSISRQRGLGLGRVVRHFNDLAVPGMGGLWFGKPMLLSLVGLHLHELIQSSGGSFKPILKRSSSIRLADAVEGWACLEALKQTNWKGDSRLQGRRKLRALANESSPFLSLVRPGVYVSQPMRMLTVQPLRELGLVEEGVARFSAYTLSEYGNRFIETVLEGRRTAPTKWLEIWQAEFSRTPGAMLDILSPLTPLPQVAARLLREHIVRSNTQRAEWRKRALEWVAELRNDKLKRAPSWEARPSMLDEQHWQAMHAGAAFFRVREAAINVLDHIEDYLRDHEIQTLPLTCDSEVPLGVQQAVAQTQSLARDAREQLERFNDISGMDSSFGIENRAVLELAAVFYSECLEQDLASCARALVRRDGRALILDEQTNVRCGPAFSSYGSVSYAKDGGDAAAGHDAGAGEGPTPVPVVSARQRFSSLPGVSLRLNQLYMLDWDLSDPSGFEQALTQSGVSHASEARESV